jgi:hypothetical protein
MEKRSLVLVTLWLVTVVFVGCGGSAAITTPVSPSTAPVSSSPPDAPQPQPPAPRAGPSGYILTPVTLSGVVYETTSAGAVPIAGARVYCELCGTETHTFAVADSNGVYVFPADLSSGGGVWLAPGRGTPVFVENRGFRDPDGLPFFRSVCPAGFSCREVFIDGDTRFDIELVRLAQ